MANFRAADIPLVIERDQKSCVTVAHEGKTQASQTN